MSDFEFNEGRVAATFAVGSKLEDTKEAYEREIVSLDGMKAALVMAANNLSEYCNQIKHDTVAGKLPIKEGDVAVKYVLNCVDLLQRMATDAEAKRFAAVGAIEALKRVVSDVKDMWEKEKLRLKEIKEFESEHPIDMKKRPVGYMPKDAPLALYNKETEQLLKEQVDADVKQEELPRRKRTARSKQ